jgi:cytochrome P450
MAEPVVQKIRMSGEAFGALHALWCFLMRQPRLLRVVAAVFRRWPIASRWVAVVAQRDAVVAGLLRTATFSNTSHAPNLVAGEFSIGMQDGQKYRNDRKTLEAMLLPARRLGPVGAVLARQHLERLVAAPTAGFDLVDDYLSPIVWRTMKRSFGRAGNPLAVGDARLADPLAVEKQLCLELRHVASHLVVGRVATPQVQGRAESAGCALNQRVNWLDDKHNPERVSLQDVLAGRLQENRLTPSLEDLRRNTVGLLWVSHPVAVQAGVNLVLELVQRDALHQDLRARVAAAGAAAWMQPELRAHLRDVILEMLRFRPPFPIVAREVPRSSSFETGDDRPALVRAGGSLKLLVIGAMFDPKALDRPDAFEPGKDRWKVPNDRYMVFGYGQRQCPGQDHALEILTSALVGLLMLPRPLRLAGRKAQRFDGPVTDHLELVF